MKKTFIAILFSFGSLFQATGDHTTDGIENSLMSAGIQWNNVSATGVSEGTASPLAAIPGTPVRSVRVLTVIQQRAGDARPVLRLKTGNLILKGRSNSDLVCGRCNTLLAQGVSADQLLDVVLYCNNCGSLNSIERRAGNDESVIPVSDQF